MGDRRRAQAAGGHQGDPEAPAGDAHGLILFRPVGRRELELVEESLWTAFPPRLEGQPIFYPVLNFAYAQEIARRWNLRDPASGFMGAVLRFEWTDNGRYPVQTVGAAHHQELWVPAEELEEFNRGIVGPIELVWQVEAGPQGDPQPE